MNPLKKQQQEIENAITEISESILHSPQDANLFYQRGFLYFYLDKPELAETDYMKAVSLGLDCTKSPYYSFSKSYEYSTRDKIVLSLFAIFFLTILALETFRFLSATGMFK